MKRENGSRPLCVFNCGYVTGQRYRGKFLNPYVEFARGTYLIFYFMTIARPHQANRIDLYLEGEAINLTPDKNKILI